MGFSKAYDKVFWSFIFHAMRGMNISEKFIKWVQLLVANASTTFNLNGVLGDSFRIERGVRQGCPLVPYLFFIMGEIIMHMIKKTNMEGRVKGVSLPGGKK